MKKSIFAVGTAILMGFVFAVALCVRALNAQAVSAFSDGSMRVIVDAGHGGIDVGVSGRETGVRESDLNLAIALALVVELEDAGFEPILTRRTEAGLYGTTAKGFKKRDMEKRREIVQKADPAAILSVHQNFYPSQSVRGGQVFYAKQVTGSEELAERVQSSVNGLYAAQGVKNRKKMPAEYFMLDVYECPSVIIECGFLSNPKDEALLQSAGWQRSLAQAITAGLLEYYAEATA